MRFEEAWEPKFFTRVVAWQTGFSIRALRARFPVAQARHRRIVSVTTRLKSGNEVPNGRTEKRGEDDVALRVLAPRNRVAGIATLVKNAG